MDPDANLKETRRLTERLLAAFDRGETPDKYDADRLCELVTALDQWIMKGGLLPRDWQCKR